MFVGITAINLHETSLVLPGTPGGLKDVYFVSSFIFVTLILQ